MNLYELTKELALLQERFDQAPADSLDEIVKEFAGIAENFKDKVYSVSCVIKNFEALAGAANIEAKRMQDRAKRLEARAEKLRDFLKNCMAAAGAEFIEYPEFKVSICKNPDHVVINSPLDVPSQLMRVKPPPPPEPDKSAIKKALANGEIIPGCHLETTTRLEIK